MAKKKEMSLGAKLGIAALLLIALLIVSSMVALMFATGDYQIGNTAVIRISGPIMTTGGGAFSEGVATSGTIVQFLEDANEDSTIDAIILEINSPGGSAVASDEIGRAVKAVDKPVVSWIREVGASGAYWVASSSDHIIANRMSITGSIGVYGSYFGFSEFLDEWNVTYNRFVSGDRKDVGDPFQEISQRDRLFIQDKMDTIHEFFIEEVAENRDMTVRDVRPLADGRFYLGIEALDAGLIDELGGKEEVLAYVENVTGETPTLVYYEEDYGLLGELLGVYAPARAPGVEDLARMEARTSAPMLR